MEENKSRVYHSLKNVRVSLFFSLIAIFIGFFSRKVFLDRLGVEFMGLTGTLQSLLGFLNIAELGIGTAVSYLLYKPLADGDREKINDIVSVLGYLYSRVGYFILGAGVILSCFLPLIFPKTGMPMLLIYCGFYAEIISSLFGYFLNCRMTLLSADQRNYVVTKNLQMSNITRQLLQMAAAKYCANLYLFFAISLVFSGIYSLILNRKIDAYYPWLNSTVANGREKLKAFPEIKILVRQVFAHRLGSLIQSQVSNLLIYAFVSLREVALYGNYITIISKLHCVTGIAVLSTLASVGNLIVGSSKEKVLSVFEEINALQMSICGFAVFVYLNTLEPFVSLWLGTQYIMPRSILIIILLDVFFTLSRNATDQFLNGYGLFQDVWAPYVEIFISAAGSLVAGYFWGICGVISCVVVSKAFMCIWKACFLFHSGIKVPVAKYFAIWGKNTVAIVISGVIVCYLARFVKIPAAKSYVNLILYTSVISGIYAVVYLPLLIFIVPGGKRIIYRAINQIVQKMS